MKQIYIYIIFLLLVLLVLLAVLIILKVSAFSSRVSYTPEVFSESADPLDNPYCGFYHIVPYTLSDECAASNDYADFINSYRESLALLEINLKNYRTAEITKAGLKQLEDILSTWASSPVGTKLILRFLYDLDGIALATEPDSLELILKHMEQVGETVNRYRDTVYIIQGVFIGNWGEMHHSKFEDDKSVKKLINKLNEVIDPPIYLSVRTPAKWRMINETYDPPSDFPSLRTEPSLTERLGLFNDGILGSETDLGTYASALKSEAESPSYIGTRDEELEFQNRLCRYVPNGGEAVFNNNLSELETSVSALKTMRISYLNADYDSRVLEKWKNSVWQVNDEFKGSDGYTYIKAHLGYRYFIDSCKIKKSGIINSVFILSLTLKNSGFSSALMPISATVTLLKEKNGESISLPLESDLRKLGGGEKKTFTVKLPLKNLKKGEYLIYFSLKDKTSGHIIALANKNKPQEYGLFLGKLIY